MNKETQALTINIDGKTFVPNGQFYFYESIYDWIKGGDLVELQPQEEQDPQIESISHIPQGGTYRKDWIKSPLNQVEDKPHKDHEQMLKR